MDKYVFPATFEPADDNGYCVTFHDLPGIVTQGNSIEEALCMAKDALELHLYGMIVDNDTIPVPTIPSELSIPEGGFVSLVEAWMPKVFDEMQNKAVKKTLTIPQWLSDAAESNGNVNYSRLLQDALKNYLGIHKPPYGK